MNLQKKIDKTFLNDCKSLWINNKSQRPASYQTLALLYRHN